MLGRQSEPLSFAGDTPTTARLLDGAITDLNVMTRRGRFSHRVSCVAQPIACAFADDAIAIILSLDGGTDITTSSERLTLGAGDAVLIEAGDTPTFQIDPVGDNYLIWLRR